jgi:hypothetical protein
MKQGLFVLEAKYSKFEAINYSPHNKEANNKMEWNCIDAMVR